MALTLTIDPKGFEKAEKILTSAGKNFPKAARDASMRGLKHGRTIADKTIRGRYAIQKKTVMAQMKVEFDSASGGGTLEAKGPMLPVSLFQPKPTQVKAGVKATILKGKRKLLGGTTFIVKGKVFERKQPKNYPIQIARTAGVPLMTSVEAVSDKIQKAIAEATTKRMEDNIKRALEGKAFR